METKSSQIAISQLLPMAMIPNRGAAEHRGDEVPNSEIIIFLYFFTDKDASDNHFWHVMLPPICLS